MSRSNKSSKKHCQCPFFKLFMAQLFEIGNSAGSLIGEAVNLFRIFQRLSATKSFVTKISSESNGMFSWATNIVKIVISKIDTKPFEDYEYYWLYTISVPVFIFTFIPCLFNGYKQLRYILFWIPFFLIGAGISNIYPKPTLFNLILIAMGLFYLIIMLACYFCCLKKRWAALEEQDSKKILEVRNTFQFTYSLCGSLGIFTAVLLPILIKRKGDIYRKYSTKIIGFLISCLSLLIIPSTNAFTDLIKNIQDYQWNCIFSYIGINLICPIVTTFMMIKTNYSEICEKYKESTSCKFNFYSYIELVDIVKQVAYAIVAAFDLPIACLAIEAFWFILIIIARPYKNVSDYSLSFGSSLVIFLSNGGIVYSDYRDTGMFSFKTTVIFVIIACIPAILSGYLFFIFDFNAKIDDSSPQEKINEDNLRYVLLISSYVAPFAFFTVGLNMFIPV